MVPVYSHMEFILYLGAAENVAGSGWGLSRKGNG